MPPDHNEPRKQIARLLRRRPGWSFQAMSTPGAPLVWCFGSGGTVQLSVTVDGHAISVHLSATDQDFDVGNAEELVQWLRTHVPGAFQEPRPGLLDKVKSGRFFKWE